MKIYTLSGLALAASLSAFALSGDELTFHVEEGTSLTKRFTFDAELDEGEISFTFGDEEPDVNPGEPLALVRTVVVTDEYRALEGGRPTELARTFDELALEVSGMEELSSDLVESTVEFNWDEEAEEYDREVAIEEAMNDLPTE